MSDIDSAVRIEWTWIMCVERNEPAMSSVEDREREIMLELVRVTETAALRAARCMGMGDCNLVDDAAVDGMRGMLSLININGVIVIGEGEKDQAPMLYCGEKVGTGRDECDVDLAVDPVEGTRLVANGLPNAISVMVVADRGALMPVPTFYMHKIAVGPEARDYIDINAPVRENLRVVAAALGRKVRDLTVVILNRPRHDQLVTEVRECGARIKLIQDGDVAAALARDADMLTHLAGLAVVKMEPAAAPKPEKAAAAVAPGVEVYLPLAGMIDIGKEIERLRRELDGLQAETAKVQAKLGNESFVAKAPPEVVQKQRDRLADLQDQLTKVQVRVAQLES